MNSSMHEGGECRQDERGTPPRPPYSPVTPVLSHTNLSFPMPSESIIPPPLTPTAPVTATQGRAFTRPTEGAVQPPGSEMPSALPSQYARESPPVPISESDNPDAIALRSAISILQMQKQQALRDIRLLDKMKQVAAEDPEGFVKELLQGSLESKEGDIFHPTAPEPDDSEQKVKVEDDDKMDLDDSETSSQPNRQQGRFGAIPKPQNVVRMPHINWAKYHIIGEPLDKLHEEQRKRPSPGEPRRDTPMSPPRAPEYHIAAPYRPFVDKIDTNMKTGDSNKRPREHT